MHHEYLMSSKEGKPAKDFRRTNAPTVGPGIKSTGAPMRLQHAKGKSVINKAIFTKTSVYFRIYGLKIVKF